MLYLYAKRYTLNAKLGFTLIELLIAIGIIGILTSVGTASFKTAQDSARDGRRKEDLKALKSALVSYYQDHSFYPPTCNPNPCTSSASFTSDAGADWIPDLIPTYIQKLPKDPKQTGFINRLAGLTHKFGTKPSSQQFASVLATSTVAISTDFDGRKEAVLSTCDDTNSFLTAGTHNSGGGPNSQRSYIRFPLDSLPAGATVTDVQLQARITSVNGTSPFTDIQAYNIDGQGNPATDDCTTRTNNTANDSTPYLNDITDFRSTGVKTLQLPASANADIENAKVVVNRFSLGLSEDGSSPNPNPGNYVFLESLEDAGNSEPKLIITYTTVGPTPTPTPTPAPTPAPAAGCTSKAGVYCYAVTAARTSFVLWAHLDRENDPQVYNQPNADCKLTLPAGSILNYCLESPQ